MDRKKSIKKGVAISLLLIATPFLFYMYKYAPTDSKEWDTIFGTINAGNFKSAQSFVHALFTKITFILLTTIWFLTSRNWWKYAILVPLIMFLYQFYGIINFQIQYIDEFDFWYSLPFIAPIIIFFIYLSYLITKIDHHYDEVNEELNEDAKGEIKKMFSDSL